MEGAATAGGPSDDSFQQFLDSATAQVASGGAISVGHSMFQQDSAGGPEVASAGGPEVASARVKDILDDLLSTESTTKMSRMRAEAQAQLSQTSTEYTAALRASETHREALEECVGELEIVAGSLQREKIDWETQRGKLMSENTRTAARLHECQVALDAERRERALRESDVAELDDQLRSNMAKHEALKRRWKAELKGLQEQLTANREGASADTASTGSQITALTNQLQAVEEELDQTRSEADQKYNRVHAELQDATARKKSMEGDLSHAEVLLAKSERQRLEWKAQHEATGGEVERLGSIQQHCVALEQQLRESEATMAQFSKRQAVMEAEREAIATAADTEGKRQAEATGTIKAELENAHAEVSAMSVERGELHKDLSAARAEVEAAHAAAVKARELQDNAEREGARALSDLNERLSSQIEARDQRLVAERGSADVALSQAMEQSDAKLQSTLDAQVSAFAREKSAALAAAAVEHQTLVESSLAEAESKADGRMQARVKEVEFEARALLSETETRQQTALQQQAFEARMTGSDLHQN